MGSTSVQEFFERAAPGRDIMRLVERMPDTSRVSAAPEGLSEGYGYESLGMR